jgi:CBS domain containing-hemolysin-like protein
MILLYISGVVISLLLLILFSGMELAFTFSNRPQLELLRKEGVYSNEILSAFIKNPAGFISTFLIGSTLSLVLYTVSVAGIFDLWLSYSLSGLPVFLNNTAVRIILQILISLLVIITTIEIIPKSLFLLDQDKFVRFFALPTRIMYWAMYPVVWVFTYISKFIITKILRFDYAQVKATFGLSDLNDYIHFNPVATQETNIEEEPEVDRKIFNNAISFRSIRVRDCMIPRTEITAVNIGEGLEKLRRTFVESGHSKILVYRETIDDVVGYCHALALFKKPKDIASIVSSIIVVAETTLASELLLRFISERKSLALVVDEFGGTAGLISLEDVMEQIFGEIQDEYDQSEDWIEQQVDDYTYLLSARHEVDYLNEKYGWDLPEGDYDTLGGLIISINNDIPSVGDIIITPRFTFTVMAMQDARIDIVKVVLAEITEEKGETE